MEKTISYLNSKIWYRFIKVAYTLLFLVISVTVIFSIFSENIRVLDMPNSQVICQYGNEKQLLIKEVFDKDEMPNILPNYYYDANTALSEKIIKSCGINEVITRSTQPDGFISDPYRIEKRYKNNITTALLYSLLSVVITILIFEIVRRVFYYIALGTIKPKK